MIDLIKQYTDHIKTACVLDTIFKAVKIYEKKYPVVFNICNYNDKYFQHLIAVESLEIRSRRYSSFYFAILPIEYNNKKVIPYYLNELRKLVCATLDINIRKADIDKIEYNEIR